MELPDALLAADVTAVDVKVVAVAAVAVELQGLARDWIFLILH